MPSDITGTTILDEDAQGKRNFRFVEGPLVTNILLADEINRTPPKTQSALLEAMAERQISVDGVTRRLPAPFHVLATSNPIEYEGTYPLPEAQLDRFMVRLSMGYPTPAQEAEVLARRIARRTELATVSQVVDADTVLAMQAGVEAARVDADIVRYCVDLAVATRNLPHLEVGASPRGSQNLLLLARAMAVLEGRDYTLPEDVKRIGVAVLAHRLTLSPTAWAAGMSPEELVQGLLNSVPGPATVGAR
jgi:MoxR-like ATPase